MHAYAYNNHEPKTRPGVARTARMLFAAFDVLELVGVGGEGIVVEEPSSICQPRILTTAWLKLKPKLTLDVLVTGGSSAPIRWGDWALAVELRLRYQHPRDGSPVEIEQAVRVRRDEVFELHEGQHAKIVAWGVMPSGMLRHPLFLRWIV